MIKYLVIKVFGIPFISTYTYTDVDNESAEESDEETNNEVDNPITNTLGSTSDRMDNQVIGFSTPWSAEVWDEEDV